MFNQITISGLNPFTNNIVNYLFTTNVCNGLFVLDCFHSDGVIRECGRFATEAEAEAKARELVAKFGIIEK